MSRSGIMLCYPFELRRLKNEIRGQTPWTAPFLLQPKLDGERCRAIIAPNGSVHLWSSEEHLITSVPHINEAIEKIKLQPGTELDGELYIHGTDFGELHSIIGRTVNIADDHETMEYHVFDLIDLTMSQLERTVYLKRMKFKPPIFIVEHTVVETEIEVTDFLISFTDLGYEGVIIRELSALYIRRRSTQIMKFKPKKSDVYQVVDFRQEQDQFGNPKESLGSLVCISDEGTAFNVGSGFTQDQRRLWWAERYNLIGKIVNVQYQHINPSGVPRFPVFLDIIDQHDSEVTYD
ncbi:hypothetical protein KAR91_22095 [Candidatus Pacearchaeota archaeon]|nr:hypothetical protein [Candidatus Pacearchaeota archaeon]